VVFFIATMRTTTRPGHEALVLQATDRIFHVYTADLGQYGTAKLVSCVKASNKVVWHHFIEEKDGYIAMRIVGECRKDDFYAELDVINKNLLRDYQRKLKPAKPVLYCPRTWVNVTDFCLKQYSYEQVSTSVR